MKKILVIGCGGIGSYFLRELNNCIINNINGVEDIDVTIYDGDKVEEKNLRYQNFDLEDLDEYKSIAMNKKYLFNYKTKFIENEEELKGYEIIIIAVDNGKLRKLVYEYCDKNSIYFIDMRSEGKTISYFTKHKENDLKFLLSTIDVEKPATSCQLKFELDKGIIQLGNRIIAVIGVQLLLNKLRDKTNPAKFIQRF